MKNLIKLLTAIVCLPILAMAQDDISQNTGVVGNGRYLGAQTSDAQTIVPVLGVNKDGNTEINALSGKEVVVSVAKTPVSRQGSSGTTFIYGGYESVAGAGTTVADAAALSATKVVHRLTGANGTVGWKMTSTMPVGSMHFLLNTTAGVALIYADVGGTVNGGATDAAFSALTGIKPIICVKTAALTYICS